MPRIHAPTVRSSALLTSLLVLIGQAACNTHPHQGDQDTLTSIPGDNDAPASEAIPQISNPGIEPTYSTDYPDLPGMEISHDTLHIVFTLDTTVAEANAIIQGLNAEIIFGLPGKAGKVEGVMSLRLPTRSHAELVPILESLSQNPNVKHVVPDTRVDETLVPQPNEGIPAAWTWDSTQGDGNWGLKRCRVPQMWNMLAAINKTGSSTVTGVFDVGFAPHPDLNCAQDLTPTAMPSPSSADHGTHVAGTIGAAYNNGAGVDGVDPAADLIVYRRGSLTSFCDMLEQRPDIRVVNVSLGYNWYKQNIDPNNNLVAQATASTAGAIFDAMIDAIELQQDAPLVVVSAGNESNKNGAGAVEARHSSLYANAGLEHGNEHILVVEALDDTPGSTGDTSLSSFSSINGNISAPGRGIWSTVGPDSVDFDTAYGSKNGTSMATPHVAGLVGFLLAVEPDLTNAQIRELLLANSVPAFGGASNRIDAWATMMDIDRVMEGDEVLRMWLDIDDGTPDGNQRTDIADGTVFDDEDADNDGGIGDGEIDMSDFRRWRDWLLQVEDPGGLALDGTTDHFKKDVNGDGDVGSAADESIYPRGDFNGDGVLDRDSLSYVPGAINDSVTDLGVLQSRFDDDRYDAADLPGLVESADLEISAAQCFEAEGSVRVTSSVRLAGMPAEPEREHISGQPREVYTLPVNTTMYKATISAFDAEGALIGTREKDFDLQDLGWDAQWIPNCSPLDIDVVFPELVFPGEPTPLSVRVGKVNDEGVTVYGSSIFVDIVVAGGTVTNALDFTDDNGLFETTATITEGNDLLTLFITAQDDDGNTVTKIVEARATGGPVEVIGRMSQLYATAVFIEDGTNGSTNIIPLNGTGPFERELTVSDRTTRGTSTQDSSLVIDPDLGLTGASMGGTVHAENSGEGVGSEFAIRAEAATEFNLSFAIPANTFYQYSATGLISRGGDGKYFFGVYTGPFDVTGQNTNIDVNNETGSSASISDTRVLGPGNYSIRIRIFTSVFFGDTGLTSEGEVDFTMTLTPTVDPEGDDS
ncbi:MAG: S8 family serine peptidase [Phycisphaerae bacterium]|nr:S8 family serine peptidase [Phycisphaerae bacterium]